MEYVTVDGEASARNEIRRSVFICNIKGIDSFEEGTEYVKEISKKYSDATHNCYAVITKDGQQKFSDDGEPQGTAGTPILQALKKAGLTNVAAVVTRYFGGIKLGANGLISSYCACCAEAAEKADKITVKFCDRLSIRLSYAEHKKTASAIKFYGIVTDTDFSDGVTVKCSIPVENTALLIGKLRELTAGKAECVTLSQGYDKFRNTEV